MLKSLLLKTQLSWHFWEEISFNDQIFVQLCYVGFTYLLLDLRLFQNNYINKTLSL